MKLGKAVRGMNRALDTPAVEGLVNLVKSTVEDRRLRGLGEDKHQVIYELTELLGAKRWTEVERVIDWRPASGAAFAIRWSEGRNTSARVARESPSRFPGMRATDLGRGFFEWRYLDEEEVAANELADFSQGLVTRLVPVPAQKGTQLVAPLSVAKDGKLLAQFIAENASPSDVLYGVLGSTEDGQVVVEAGDPALRPRYFDAQTLLLASNAVPSRKLDDLETFARGFAEGRTVVETDDVARTVTIARLDHQTALVRKRFAEAKKVAPSEVEVRLNYAPGESTSFRLDRIEVIRLPKRPLDPEKRNTELRALLAIVLGDETAKGWSLAENTISQSIEMTFGEPRKLPGIVAMESLLPAKKAENDWNLIPLGRTPSGAPAGVDLTLGPHLLLVGPTGTGKTIALIQYIMGALVRGFEVILIDTAKEGSDFKALSPFFSATAFTVNEAADLLPSIYVEAYRRKKILAREGVGFWADLPEDVRIRENIKPLAVVIDEYGNLTSVPSGTIDKNTPWGAAQAESKTKKGAAKYIVERIAAETRFVGIYLVIGIQRPSARLVDTDFRDNLTSVAQLVKPGKPPRRESIGMVFSEDDLDDALTVISELDDGKSRGLGVVAADGGGVEGFRVGFTPDMAALPEMLAARGIEPPTQSRVVIPFEDAMTAIAEEKMDALVPLLQPSPMTVTRGPDNRIVLPGPDAAVFDLWAMNFAATPAEAGVLGAADDRQDNTLAVPAPKRTAQVLKVPDGIWDAN